LHRPSSSQVPETSCNRPRASIGTEGHALDPRITPSRTACAVWEITGFKVGAVAVVAASAMTAAKAAVLITVRMGHVRLGAAPSRSVGLNSTQFAMRFLLFWGDGENFPSEPHLEIKHGGNHFMVRGAAPLVRLSLGRGASKRNITRAPQPRPVGIPRKPVFKRGTLFHHALDLLRPAAEPRTTPSEPPRR